MLFKRWHTPAPANRGSGRRENGAHWDFGRRENGAHWDFGRRENGAHWDFGRRENGEHRYRGWSESVIDAEYWRWSVRPRNLTS